MKCAITLVRSENPPLVLEFGDNHYGAWVRNVQMHKGPKVVEGLTRAFPDLVEKGGGKRKAQTKGTGQGGAAAPKPQRRHKHKQGQK